MNIKRELFLIASKYNEQNKTNKINITDDKINIYYWYIFNNMFKKNIKIHIYFYDVSNNYNMLKLIK